MTKLNPFLKSISIGDLDSITISSASSDRSYGRRFSVVTNNGKQEVVFNQLFLKAKMLMKSTEDVDELNTVKDFILKLKTLEKDAKAEYKERGCVYRFRTRFHQFFGEAYLGSHTKRLNTLELKLDQKIHFIQEPIYDRIADKKNAFKYYLENNSLTVDGYSFKFKGDVLKLNDELQINFASSKITYKDNSVKLIPTKFEAIFNEFFKKSSKYEISKLMPGTVFISILKESLIYLPEWHLKQFSNSFEQTFQVKFIGDEVAQDAGGPSREYVDTLATSLLSLPKLFFNAEGSLKLPGHSGKYSQEEKETYETFGKLLKFTYLFSMPIGIQFSDVFFNLLLSFTREELATPFEELDRSTHIKLFRALNEGWDKDPDFAKRINFCLDVIETSDLKACMENKKDFNTAAAYAGFIDEDFNTDDARILANPDEFKEALYSGLFNDINVFKDKLNGMAPNSLFEPIYLIAKGLVPLPISLKPLQLNKKIQGSMDRETIIDRITASEVQYPHLTEKKQWLSNWLKKDASDAEVKQFLRFSTGASSLLDISITLYNNSEASILANTCFGRIFLPEIKGESEEDFIASIKWAMQVTGFQRK